MFVKWESRSRAYGSGRNLISRNVEPLGPVRQQRRRSDTWEPHRTLIARLVESHRVNDVPRQRIIAHLGTCREPVSALWNRHWFYKHCDEVLARLELSPTERERVDAQLAARLPRPTDAELDDNARVLAAREAAISRALSR